MPDNYTILGAGFIGKNLLKSCLDMATAGSIRVLDTCPCPDDFQGKVEWIQGAFGNSADVTHAIKGADVVFHLISSTVPGDDVIENEEILNNVVQTLNLLKICLQEHVRRVVFISSASVYGIQQHLPISENSSTDPISSHGVHKLTIEKYLQLYQYKYGLDCKIMRLSNPYGFGQNVYGRQGFVSIGIGKILTGGSLNVMGDGSAIRDFIYIDDVVAACHLLAQTDVNETVFNIGSGNGIRIKDVLSQFHKYTKTQIKVEYIESRRNDIAASILDIRKAKEMLGFQASISFNVGLRMTLSLYEKQYPELRKLLKEFM